MYFKTTYDPIFEDLYMHLKAKYPDKLFDLDGIGKQLDMSEFSKSFFSSKVAADSSIDANANVDDTSIITYNVELPKPFFRLNSYYILWKELKRLYSLEVANTIIEMQLTGDIYIHDFHGFAASIPYCFNYSTYDILVKGLPMVKKVKSIPPKHLHAFKSQLEQFVIIASNSTLGATGLADLLVVLSYFTKNILKNKSDAHYKFETEDDCWTYVKEMLTSFVYSVNFSLRANQSPFTNVSVYDKYFLEKFVDDYLFPDGTSPDIEIIQKIQKIYLGIMNQEMKRTALTYPVTTACFSVDEDNNILDKEFLKFIAKENQEFGFINIYCGKTSTLSSCCFDKNQKTLTKSSAGVNYMSFEELDNANYGKFKKNFTIFHNGSWVKGKITKKKTDEPLVKIITANKKEFLVTKDHIHPTITGDKKSYELTDNDYLLFNNLSLDTFPEVDEKLSYSDGYAIGMYLGDGSTERKSDNHTPTIHFSLNEEKYLSGIEILKNSFQKIDEEKELKLGKQYNNVFPVHISSEKIYFFIKKWVFGSYAQEKELNLNCLLQSREFRQGILDGYYATDGGNSNRIYTSSKNLVGQIECLLTSLGLNSIIDESDRRDEPVIIRGDEFKRNHIIYCIRWYSPKNKRVSEDIFKIKNNSMYFKISNIEQVDKTEEYVYCFEIENKDEPYFTLPNGLITHNCRLRSEADSEYFNSFGSGSSKIGSLGVCTINLPRLAIKNKGNVETFKKSLLDMVDVCSKINNAKRRLIEKRIKNGNEPLYSLGFMELERQYSTVGLNGINEFLEIMGFDILQEPGQSFLLESLDIINGENKKLEKQYSSPHNVEQVPGENMSIKLAEKDKLLGYQNCYDIYSNQFIPLVTKADLLDRIYLQGLFDKHFTGGAICHINVDNKIENVALIEKLIESTAKMGVVYHAINYNLQECEDGHMSVGMKKNCAICGKDIVNNYTRIVGFLTNTRNWHRVRREQDYPHRQFYHDIAL